MWFYGWFVRAVGIVCFDLFDYLVIGWLLVGCCGFCYYLFGLIRSLMLILFCVSWFGVGLCGVLLGTIVT